MKICVLMSCCLCKTNVLFCFLWHQSTTDMSNQQRKLKNLCFRASHCTRLVTEKYFISVWQKLHLWNKEKKIWEDVAETVSVVSEVMRTPLECLKHWDNGCEGIQTRPSPSTGGGDLWYAEVATWGTMCVRTNQDWLMDVSIKFIDN